MRLACPNCDAKYEVPDDAIPETGRDVQCSNCGHTWFQPRPEAELAAAEEASLYGDDLPVQPRDEASDPELTAALAAAMTDPLPAAAAAAVAAPAGAGAFPEDDLPEDGLAEDDLAEDDLAGPPADAADPPKRALDDAVLSVLREEAEREAEARRHEAQHEAQRAETRRAEAEGQMQVQADLGMGEPTPAARPALTPTQRRLAMLKGEDPDAPPPEPARPAARRDLLPDVEEINSTLQPGDEGPDPDALVDSLPDLTRSRFGFRTGFLLMIFLAIVAAVVYIAAPSLSAAVPALEAPLAAYVSFVDGLRSWLDGVMNAATQALNGTPGG